MRLKLIYNPYSGNRSFKNNLDACIEILQNSGYDVHIFRSSAIGDIDKHISKMQKGEYSAIVVSGGDGTINIVLNAMRNYGHEIPLGIIPSGTANDFAEYLKIPADAAKAAELIAAGNTMHTDIGIANDKYFVNVCAAGLMANVSQAVDPNLKNAFGKLAYYIKGLEQLPNFVPLPMKIINSRNCIEADLYFFTILNSAGTGGFEHLSPGAAIDDGLFDFIGFKAVSIVELAKLFVRVLKNEYLDDPNIVFFRDKYIKVSYRDAKLDASLLYADVDGEKGPPLPIEVKNIPKALEVFIDINRLIAPTDINL